MSAPENSPNYGIPNWPAGARLPIPGNAEFALLILAAIVIAIIVAVDDGLTAGAWLDFMKWTTAAYLISRGIAKASRVLEQ